MRARSSQHRLRLRVRLHDTVRCTGLLGRQQLMRGCASDVTTS